MSLRFICIKVAECPFFLRLNNISLYAYSVLSFVFLFSHVYSYQNNKIVLYVLKFKLNVYVSYLEISAIQMKCLVHLHYSDYWYRVGFESTVLLLVFVFYFILVVLRIEPRVLHSTTDLHPKPLYFIF
jgi:hypothetical protein